MATDPNSMQTHQSFADFVKTHEGLVIGGGLVLVLVIAGQFMKAKTPTTASTTPNSLQDLSGLTNGVVYVPTSTTFTTINKNSNDPTTTYNNSNNTTTGGSQEDNDKKCGPGYTFAPATPGVAIVKGAIPVSGGYCIPKTTVPVNPPPRVPPPQPPPPTTTKGLIWDTRYTISGGETLSSIAARLTNSLRGQGMPGSMILTWHDLYAHNTSVINATSAAHHNPIPGGPWNDIFPGETITVPRWG